MMRIFSCPQSYTIQICEDKLHIYRNIKLAIYSLHSALSFGKFPSTLQILTDLSFWEIEVHLSQMSET